MDQPQGEAKVIGLFGQAVEGDPPDPSIIEKLELILAKARSGELKALAICTVNADRAIGTSYRATDGTDIFALMGALDIVKSRIVRDLEQEYE